MRVYLEDKNYRINDINSEIKYFEREVPNINFNINMHDYIINNREKIFGQYIYLINEVELSKESCIDFIGFNDEGAIFIIEVKRANDSRNRQEVISQIGKYAIDSLSIKSILEDKSHFNKLINDKKLKNRTFSEKIISKIRNNINQNCLNLFLITEEATDAVLTSCYYLSYGKRFQKISVIELKRILIDNKIYCLIRKFNEQTILSTTRKEKYDLYQKIKLIENEYIKFEITKQIERWFNWGFDIDPLTPSTPWYITFQWKKSQSIKANFYLLEYKQNNFSDKINANSISFLTGKDWTGMDLTNEYESIIKWFKTQKSTKIINCKNPGKTGDHLYYCIDLTDYNSDEIDIVFEKLYEIANIQKKNYKKVSLKKNKLL